MSGGKTRLNVPQAVFAVYLGLYKRDKLFPCRERLGVTVAIEALNGLVKMKSRSEF